MKTVLLPVKGFDRAKSRLAPLLESAQRARLAAAMFRDVATTLAATARIDRIIVITADPYVEELTRPFGFDLVDEPNVAGHSDAVNRMSRDLVRPGDSLLALAADLPLLCPEEVDGILKLEAPGVIVIPNREGTGTNGLMMLDGCRIETAYGEGSLARHRHRAHAAGLRVDIVEVAGIGFDVDTPDDLADLGVALDPASFTGRFLDDFSRNPPPRWAE